MTEKEVLVKGLKINYKIFPARNASHSEAGRDRNGVPFLILHGWGSKTDRWTKVGELLSNGNLQIFIPDSPGFGSSQNLSYPWSLDDYVEWVNELSNIIPELKTGFYLLGNSFGGAVATKFSIKYPQKVKQLFLVAAACIRKRTFKITFLEGVSKIIKIFSFLPFYDLGKRAFYKYVVGSYDYLKADQVMKETFKKTTEDLSQKLLFVRVPTVIIWGDKDESTPLYQGEIIHKRIENSKMIIIEGGDHYLQHKMPEIMAQKVLENI